MGGVTDTSTNPITARAEAIDRAREVWDIDPNAARVEALDRARAAGVSWPDLAEGLDYARQPGREYDRVTAAKALQNWWRRNRKP